MQIKHEQGYLVLAVDTDSVGYVDMARQLSSSLKAWHPAAQVCLLTDKPVDCGEFDYVNILPHGNLGGYSNDWQCWEASPFRETVKLEADMLITSEIDHWWTMFRHQDVVISTGARDFYDRTAESRHYRQVFDKNNLPDVYNAITYWRVSQTAKEFWKTVKLIFEEWQHFRSLIKFAPDTPDTDLVYAMAATVIGDDRVTLPMTSYPKIVHMKKHIAATKSNNWTDDLTWEYNNRTLKVHTIQQWGCFHYNVKNWNPNDQR